MEMGDVTKNCNSYRAITCLRMIEWETLETELGIHASDLNITGEATIRKKGNRQGTKMKSGGDPLVLNFPNMSGIQRWSTI